MKKKRATKHLLLDPNPLPEALRQMAPISKRWLLAPPSPMEFAVDGLVALSEIGVVAACGGTGKTSLMIRLGLAVSMGTDTAGLKITVPRKVMYCMFERHERNFRRRIYRTWRLMRETIPDEQRKAGFKLIRRNFYPVPLTGEHLGLVTKERGNEWHVNYKRVKELAAICTEHEIELIVIDTIGRASDGSGIDDGLAKAMVKALEKLTTMANVGIQFLAHVGKTARNDMYAVFGSSVWVDMTSSFIALIDIKGATDNDVTVAKGEPEPEFPRDRLIKLEHRRGSDMGLHPDKYFILYGGPEYGGLIVGCTYNKIQPSLDQWIRESVFRVRQYYEQHGAIAEYTFWYNKLGGEANGRDRQVFMFEKLIEEKELLRDRSVKRKGDHYRPAPIGMGDNYSTFPAENSKSPGNQPVNSRARRAPARKNTRSKSEK